LAETKEARFVATVDRRRKLDDVAAVEIHRARGRLRILIVEWPEIVLPFFDTP
jgi:hypothetical protein